MVRNSWTLDIQAEGEDDWTKIQDAAARKRVQNKLAQRAHRRKYGRSKKNAQDSNSSLSSSSSSPSDSTSPSSDPHPLSHQNTLVDDVQKDFMVDDFPSDPIDLSLLDAVNSQSNSWLDLIPFQQTPITQTTTTSLHQNANSFGTLTPQMDRILINTTLTLSAILINASLLGIPCGPSNRVKSIHLQPNVSAPTSLAPTALQTTIPHMPYIDLLPFSSLRDNLLRAGDIIDAREMWSDLQTEVKVWGNSPWDEKGWEIHERFAVKWWFLMTEEVLDVANWWRSLRGEKALTLSGIRGAFKERLLLEGS